MDKYCFNADALPNHPVTGMICCYRYTKTENAADKTRVRRRRCLLIYTRHGFATVMQIHGLTCLFYYSFFFSSILQSRDVFFFFFVRVSLRSPAQAHTSHSVLHCTRLQKLSSYTHTTQVCLFTSRGLYRICILYLYNITCIYLHNNIMYISIYSVPCIQIYWYTAI